MGPRRSAPDEYLTPKEAEEEGLEEVKAEELEEVEATELTQEDAEDEAERAMQEMLNPERVRRVQATSVAGKASMLKRTAEDKRKKEEADEREKMAKIQTEADRERVAEEALTEKMNRGRR